MKVWIIADLHEDIIRTNEAISLLKEQKCEKIICLWDILGIAVPFYGYMKSRNGSEVIKVVKENCDVILIGNHDLFCIKKLPEYSDFDYPENWYSLDYPTRVKLANNKIRLHENNELSPLISDEEKEYVKNLPESLIEEIDGIKILFSHWIYPDLAGVTKFEAKDISECKEHFDLMEKNGCTINFAGHAHHKRYSFSKEWLMDINFNQKVKVNNSPIWFVVPCVANWTFPNGVTIFDTKTMEVEFLPLNTPPHIVPERAKL